MSEEHERGPDGKLTLAAVVRLIQIMRDNGTHRTASGRYATLIEKRDRKLATLSRTGAGPQLPNLPEPLGNNA